MRKILLLCLVALAPCLRVEASPGCTVRQITESSTGSSTLPAISRDGSAIVYLSNADPLGENADRGLELFLWRPPDRLIQITDDPGTLSTNEPLAINGDGSRVAFVARPEKLTLAPEYEPQLHLWDEVTGIERLTFSSATTSAPSIDASGRRIAVRSIGAALETGLAQRMILLWEESAGLREIDDWSPPRPHGFGPPAVSGDGDSILFTAWNTSAAGPTSIHRWRESTGPVSMLQANQVWPDTLALDLDASSVAFVSSDDFTGSNPDGGTELYLWMVHEGLRQITDTSSGWHTPGGLDADGGRLVFTSTADVVGTNEGGNSEVFLWDGSAGLIRITETPTGHSRSASISADGRYIAFCSQADLTGWNPDGGSEIFLATCPDTLTAPPLAAPALSSRAAAAFALLLAVAAWIALRR